MPAKPSKPVNPVLEIAAGMAREARGLWARIPQDVRQRAGQTLRGLAAGAAAVIVITAVGIYALGWQNAWSKAVSRWVPYPAAFVNFRPVSYYDYVVQARAARGYLEASDSKTAAKEISQQAMGQTINNALFASYAESHHIKVSDRETKAEVDQVFAGQGGDKAALEVLRKNYGATRADFTHLVHQQLLRLKVEQALAGDTQLKAAARQQLEEALKSSSDFAEVVRNHSQHPAAVSDSPVVAASTLPTMVASAAAQLIVGQLSGQIYAESSYYVVRREAGEGEPQVRVLQIRAGDGTSWLAEQFGHAKILKLLHNS